MIRFNVCRDYEFAKDVQDISYIGLMVRVSAGELLMIRRGEPTGKMQIEGNIYAKCLPT
jgi:hypothetical protein